MRFLLFLVQTGLRGVCYYLQELIHILSTEVHENSAIGQILYEYQEHGAHTRYN